MLLGFVHTYQSCDLSSIHAQTSKDKDFKVLSQALLLFIILNSSVFHELLGSIFIPLVLDWRYFVIVLNAKRNLQKLGYCGNQSSLI